MTLFSQVNQYKVMSQAAGIHATGDRLHYSWSTPSFEVQRTLMEHEL